MSNLKKEEKITQSQALEIIDNKYSFLFKPGFFRRIVDDTKKKKSRLKGFNLDHHFPYSDEIFKGDFNIYIAGGALISALDGTHPKDIDVFTESVYNAQALVRILLDNGHKLTYSNDYLSNFKVVYNGTEYNVQIIKRAESESCHSIIAGFDFVICCVAYDGNNLYSHSEFINDYNSRALNINNLTDPIGSLSRLAKYCKKGFTPNNQTLLQIAKSINELAGINWADPLINTLEFYANGNRRRE